MTDKTNQNVWLAAALILVVLVAGFAISGGNVTEDEVKSIVSDELSKLSFPTATEISSGIVVPEYEFPEFPEYDFSGDYVVSKAEYEDTLIEKEAEKLVLEEVDSKEFKKAVEYALVEFNESIEDYKDITDIVVKDLDVVTGAENATVTVDLKVYYYVDGDEDEDFRARFDEITFTVTELVVDDFEEAEVTYLPLEVNKVY